MGWNCYSIKPKRAVDVVGDFALKDKELKSEDMLTDSFLQIGGLDSSDCEKVMRKIGFKTRPFDEPKKSMINPESSYDVSYEEIEVKYNDVNWEELSIKDIDKWAIYSVKAFLEVCIKNKLEIYFSY